MDGLLCDELIEEILQKLPSSSSSAVSLVSKRWFRLYRTSLTSLSLRLLNYSSLSSLLIHFPSLSSLSILSPLSLSSILPLSSPSTRLTSLSINLPRPLDFRWLLRFPSLKSFSVSVFSGDGDGDQLNFDSHDWGPEAELGLHTLSLSGLRPDDLGADWLWRSCKNLHKLHLRSCESVGALSSFAHCLPELREVELRTCRSTVDGVLSKLSEICRNLTSVLVYDGGNREGLLRFISGCRSNLQSLDLRLPLDLCNVHLFAIATNLRGLSCLRLQSCCLVTGDGLKAIGTALSSQLEELALINCDVVERESGLLAAIGQSLKRLRKLDLSHNDMLGDRDLGYMVVSCSCLRELKLRGCKKLSGGGVVTAVKSCKNLEAIDIAGCAGIESEIVELCVMNLRRLRLVKVEEDKVSEVTRTWASRRFVEVVV